MIIAGAIYHNAKVYSIYEYAALRANPAFHATLGTYGRGLHFPSTPTAPNVLNGDGVAR